MHLLSITYKLNMKYFNQHLQDDVWVKFRAGKRRKEAGSKKQVLKRNVPLTSALQQVHEMLHPQTSVLTLQDTGRSSDDLFKVC